MTENAANIGLFYCVTVLPRICSVQEKASRFVLTTAPSPRKGCFTSTCTEWSVIGPLEGPRLRCFKPSKCELGRKIKQNTRLRVQHSNQTIYIRYIVKKCGGACAAQPNSVVVRRCLHAVMQRSFVSNFCETMAFNGIAVGAATEGSVVATGHLGNDSYDRKCSKHMFVLRCYSTDAN